MSSSPKAEESENQFRDCAEVFEMRMLPCLCQRMFRVTDSLKFFFIFLLKCELPCLCQGMFMVSEPLQFHVSALPKTMDTAFVILGF